MKRQFKILSFMVALVAAFSFAPINVQAVSINQQLINNNRSYQVLSPQGITIHDTSNPGATAQNNRDYFNRVYVGASAHYFVDWNNVIQTVPNDEVGWHAGYTGNHRYLSIEMCTPKNGDQEAFNIVYKNTVELAAQLCKQYGWNANDNIFSHKYLADTYRETDHQDPYRFLSQYGKSWGELCSDIQKAINGQSIEVIAPVQTSDPVEVPKATNGFTYANNAKVAGDDLYIRDESGTKIQGRYISDGDNITVLDISYSKQLVLVEYPTSNGVSKGYVKNVPSLINYYYDSQYANGSTSEVVFMDKECNNTFGNLDSREKATPLFRDSNGRLNVIYSTGRGQNSKNGFVKWNDHFNKF